jgi:uncharacterized protein
VVGSLRFPGALAGAIVGALLSWTAPVVAAEQAVPRNDGWVTDLARFLSPPQERALEDSMESYRRGSGNDIALLTVPSLNGDPIENFALRVAREWKLGAAGKNNGALLVVARDDREMRIEVGRGLEGVLTDAICGRIIRDVLTPRFQSGDFAEGLRLGVESLQHAAGGDFMPLDSYARPHRGHGVGFFPGGLIFFFIILAIVRAVRRNRYGGWGGGSSGSIWPWLIVADSMTRSSRGRSGGGSGWGSGGGGGGFSGFGGGGGFSGGGASGRW